MFRLMLETMCDQCGGAGVREMDAEPDNPQSACPACCGTGCTAAIIPLPRVTNAHRCIITVQHVAMRPSDGEPVITNLTTTAAFTIGDRVRLVPMKQEPRLPEKQPAD